MNNMDKVISSLEEIKNINTAYNISTDGINNLQKEILEAKVCTPVIGKFSSGKSALINTILGYNRKILKEDITPETAIPAEITYTDAEDMVTIIGNDGTYKTMSIEAYRGYEADAETLESARIQLRNNFLKEIPDVMLVDMPGFESGFEIHNKAIDNYLPRSLAYIVAFPADDMIVRSSVGNILKELCLHDMPLCVVITKYDKRTDEFEVTFEKMKESLKRFVGDRDIRYCITSSFTGDAEEVEEFLEEIQEKSQEILANKYKKLLVPILENTENYLVTTLNGSKLSESELDEKEEKIEKQLSTLNTKFSKEQQDFDQEVAECIEEIKSDVQRALEVEESKLVAMIMNNQDIKDHLNSVVRNAVTSSVKQRFIPKVERYLKKVAKTINSDAIGDINVSVAFDLDKLKKGITGSIVAVVAGILLGFPILGAIVAFAMKLSRDKKREEAKQAIRQKLRAEVFPQVLQEIGHGIEMTITKEIKMVNTTIEEELTNQRNTLEKAMADLHQQAQDEKKRKENLAIDIKADLERIEGIKNELR